MRRDEREVAEGVKVLSSVGGDVGEGLKVEKVIGAPVTDFALANADSVSI